MVNKSGFVNSIRVCLRYYYHWLGSATGNGVGAFALANLMEDSSTVEICRAQLWFWIKNKKRIYDMEMNAKPTMFNSYLDKEVKKYLETGVNERRLNLAAGLLKKLVLDQATFPEYFDQIAYEQLLLTDKPQMQAKL